MFKLKKRLIRILANHTGKSEEEVQKDSDRDNYMSAEEAKAYGLVDEVVKSRKELPAALQTTAENTANAAEKGESSSPEPWPARPISRCAASAANRHAEVRKLIAGPGVYICDSCINVCKGILDKELNEDAAPAIRNAARAQAGGNPASARPITSSARITRRRR